MDNANLLFLAQCAVAGIVGACELFLPALLVDTSDLYTAHRLYGATVIVNALIGYTMYDASQQT